MAQQAADLKQLKVAGAKDAIPEPFKHTIYCIKTVKTNKIVRLKYCLKYFKYFPKHC